MKKLSIETSRLRLRTLPASYASKTLEFYMLNKEFLEPFEPSRSAFFYTKAHQRQMLKWDLEGMIRSHMIRVWIFKKEDLSKPIGTIALSNIVRGILQSCNIGYKMDKEHLRQGYMCEALQSMIDYAFESLNLHRIEANIMPSNIPSLNLAQKLGFNNEGLSTQYLKINNIWEDHYRMSLINPKDL